MTRKVKIYLGWISTGQREDVHLYLLRDLRDRYGDLCEFVLPDLCAHRIFHDRARNDTVEDFLASNCDVLWFLDSDVVPPTHILDLIAHHYDKWQVSGAVYPVYHQVPGTNELSIVFTCYNGIQQQGDGRGIFMSEVPGEGTAFVDALATGCLFIKREVFAKLEKPYFEFKYDKESRRITEGEDLGFALKLHDLGIKFFTDYSMVCKHIKRVCLLEMNNYAMKMGNARVLEYDQQVRGQMTAAIQAAYKQGYEKALQESRPVHQPNRTKTGLILPDHIKV